MTGRGVCPSTKSSGQRTTPATMQHHRALASPISGLSWETTLKIRPWNLFASTGPVLSNICWIFGVKYKPILQKNVLQKLTFQLPSLALPTLKISWFSVMKTAKTALHWPSTNFQNALKTSSWCSMILANPSAYVAREQNCKYYFALNFSSFVLKIRLKFWLRTLQAMNPVGQVQTQR